MDDCPTKRVSIFKGSPVDTFLMKILSTKNYLITSLKYNDKHMAIIKRIKNPENPVL